MILSRDGKGTKSDYTVITEVKTSLLPPPPPTLNVLANDKRGGLKVVAFDRSPFKLFTLRFFKQIRSTPHPVRGLKLLTGVCLL